MGFTSTHSTLAGNACKYERGLCVPPACCCPPLSLCLSLMLPIIFCVSKHGTGGWQVSLFTRGKAILLREEQGALCGTPPASCRESTLHKELGCPELLGPTAESTGCAGRIVPREFPGFHLMDRVKARAVANGVVPFPTLRLRGPQHRLCFGEMKSGANTADKGAHLKQRCQ